VFNKQNKRVQRNYQAVYLFCAELKAMKAKYGLNTPGREPEKAK